MDFYPAELATPPLALVALLGCPDMHGIVGEFLRAAQKPPINSLGIAEPAMAARLFGAKKAFITAPSGPLNILKADWFAKHRQQRPAVAVVFLERDAVQGDPSQWSKILAGLEAVRQATRPRGAKTVVVIVHPPDVPSAEVPDDRLAGIIRQSGTDRKWVISINTADGDLALKRLGRTLYEAAGMFYLDDARRRLAVHQERRNPAPQTSAKVAFKVAALAEFRADWATAVKTYQAAYLELLRINPVGQHPLQRWTELTSVAEIMHLKAVTLLLHQANVPEALKQFAQHMSAFRKIPLPPPPAAASAHGTWLVRQYTVMGELLSSRVEAGLLPQQREAQPAHFYLGAANAAIDRRRAAQRAAELRPPGASAGVGVAPGAYIGQLVTSDAQTPRHLSDEEFLHHLEAGEAAATPALATAALDKLKQAHEMVMRAGDGARLTRLAYQLGALMAREQLVAQDPASARRLLQSVAGIYRREGWEVPLGAALLELRECASRLKLQEEHIRCSLELSCLEQCLDRPQRQAMAQAAISELTGPLTSPAQPPSPVTKSPRAAQGQDKPVTNAALEFTMRPVNYGLNSALALTCGFTKGLADEPVPSGSGTAWRFAIAVWSNLPVDLPVTAIEVNVRNASGHVSRAPAQAILHRGTAPSTEPVSSSESAAGGSAPGVVVKAETWTRVCVYGGVSALKGPVRVTDVILRVGSDAAIVWTLANLPAGAGPVGRLGPAAQQAKPPFQDTEVAAGQYELSALMTHEPPSLQVRACRSAMAGEQTVVTASVHVSHDCPAQQGTVSATYADGGEPPLLSLEQSPDGDTPPGSHSRRPGHVQIPIPALKADTGHQTALHMLCSRPGAVTVEVQLTTDPQPQRSASQSLDAPARADASAAVTLTVVQPFEVRASCTAATRCCAYIPAPEGADTAQSQVLPVGVPCIVQASLGSVAPSDILLHSLCLERSISSDGADSGVEVLHCSSAAHKGQPVAFRKGDVQTVVGSVLCKQPCSAVSVASLAVTWQRSSSRDADMVTGSSSSKTEQEPDSDQVSAVTQSASVPVTTRIPVLPAYSFSQAPLQVTASWPPFITVGKPFALQLRASNATQHVLDLSLRLGDTTGFMLAGTRSGTRAVLPHSEGTVSYELVALTGGSLSLPEVTIRAAQLGVQLQPLAGRKVYAAPAPKGSLDGPDLAGPLVPRMAELAVQ